MSETKKKQFVFASRRYVPSEELLADCYLEFKPIPTNLLVKYYEMGEEFKSSKDQSKVAEKAGNEFFALIKLMQDHFVAGKWKVDTQEELVDVEQADLEEFPFSVLQDVLGFLFQSQNG